MMKKRHYTAPAVDLTEVAVERGFAESLGDVSFENGYGNDFEDTYAGGAGQNLYY